MPETKDNIEHLKEERDKINSEVQILIGSGKKYSTEIKKIHKDIEDIKTIKNKRTKVVNTYNLKKNQLKKKIREFKKQIREINKKTENAKDSINGNLKSIEKKYKTLNWKLQTEVMSPPAEDKLSKEVAKLEEVLKKATTIKTTKKELDDIDSKLSVYAYELNIINDLIFDINQDCGSLHSNIIQKYNSN